MKGGFTWPQSAVDAARRVFATSGTMRLALEAAWDAAGVVAQRCPCDGNRDCRRCGGAGAILIARDAEVQS